jgi:hypothetical protein
VPPTWYLQPIKWLYDIYRRQPAIQANLHHGVCFYACRADQYWRFCTSDSPDAVLFVQLTLLVVNRSSRPDGVTSVRIRLQPFTEINPVDCYIGNRQPLVVQSLGADTPGSLRVLFELPGADLAGWPSWDLSTGPEWHIEVQSLRGAFVPVPFLPQAFLLRRPGGEVASYDDPPISAAWIRALPP